MSSQLSSRNVMTDLALSNPAALYHPNNADLVCKTIVQCLQVNSLDPEPPTPTAATLVMIRISALAVTIHVMVLEVMTAGAVDASTLRMVMTGATRYRLLSCSKASKQSVMSWAYAHWTSLMLVPKLHGLASSLSAPSPHMGEKSAVCLATPQAIPKLSWERHLQCAFKSSIKSPGHSCAVTGTNVHLHASTHLHSSAPCGLWGSAGKSSV